MAEIMLETDITPYSSPYMDPISDRYNDSDPNGGGAFDWGGLFKGIGSLVGSIGYNQQTGFYKNPSPVYTVTNSASVSMPRLITLGFLAVVAWFIVKLIKK